METIRRDEEGGVEVSGFDIMATSTVFLACVGGEPAGTIRLVTETDEVTAAEPISMRLPLGTVFSYRDLPPGCIPGELGRTAVLPQHRGSPIVGELYRALHRKSRALGLTHWVGLVLTETDEIRDASIMLEAMRNSGVPEASARATLREKSTKALASSRPFYSDQEREEIRRGVRPSRLSSAVRFNLSDGVEIAGGPEYLQGYNEYVIPVIVDIDKFPLSGFGQRLFQ